MGMITFYKMSGVFIIIVALVFSVGQIGITKLFNYPQILRAPVDIILQKYHDGGKRLRFFWTCNALGGLMIIPMSAMFYKILNRNDTPYLIIGATFGIASGIFYVLGFMRWVFLAYNLSSKYVSENTSPIMKETMGFLCMGIWISISGIAMLGSSIVSTLIGIGFIVCGIGILVGPLEWIGLKFPNKINKLSMKILMFLLICIGIKLIIY